jgi:hypothetical protein
MAVTATPTRTASASVRRGRRLKIEIANSFGQPIAMGSFKKVRPPSKGWE